MILRSDAFADGRKIPLEYTCEGDDVSPPLQWADVPADAKTLVLIVEDPDAPRPPWIHWVLFNLPAEGTPSLARDLSGSGRLPAGTVEGVNSWGTVGWRGPCPPSGTHRYVFRSWALDHALDLPPGTSAAEVRDAMQGHQLAEATLTGRYARD
ncbi:MAG TPA: YbhB/YbcL family Raf kinase inhibitor-like protein [Longimicrobiales bacterium]|nr:YbhB/YbcL family Raf kinase inhibitor-like protein [Longimicrobiales bacterium]